MSTAFQRLVSRFYSAAKPRNATILGLESGGKTTILYLLKLGEIVQTIPSIGFNVENVDVPLPTKGNKTSGKSFNVTIWDLGAACATIREFYPMIRIYLELTNAVIWVVDSSDRSRLLESVEVFGEILKAIDRREDVQANRMKVPILILANKSDKPNSLSVGEVQNAFKKEISGRLASVFKTQATLDAIGNLSVSGLPQAFDWLSTAFEIVKSSEATGKSIAAGQPSGAAASERNTPTLVDQRAPNFLAHKLETWVVKTEGDMSDEECLDRFKVYTLPEWDHYTHIRIAHIILTKFGRQEGKDMIFKGIEDYIKNSQQTKGRAFHVSMTYFWIQIVHLGIRNTPPLTISPASAAPLNEFARFLLVNPHVVDGNIWSDYYSKEVLMSPKAKEEMVLPDKKPLPNLVARDAITSFGVGK